MIFFFCFLLVEFFVIVAEWDVEKCRKSNFGVDNCMSEFEIVRNEKVNWKTMRKTVSETTWNTIKWQTVCPPAKQQTIVSDGIEFNETNEQNISAKKKLKA